MELKNIQNSHLVTSDKIISFIVCGNGYGHFKRVLLVCNMLLDLNDNFKIYVFCSIKHKLTVNNKPNFKSSSKKIIFRDCLHKNEPDWLSKKTYTFLKWKNWIEDIKKNKVINNSDLLVSDNQIGPLKVFENTILMGSFLWPFLNLAQSDEIELIMQKEIELIEKIKPKCLCLEDMSMKELRITNQVKLDWFCEKHQMRSKSFVRRDSFKILLTGGGTESLIDELILIFKYLSSIDNIIIFVDEKLSEILHRLNIESKKTDGVLQAANFLKNCLNN